MTNKLPELTDDLKRSLKSICDHFEDEDDFVRQRQLRISKQLKHYWNGFQRVWWSETAHDWRIFDESHEGASDSAYYDKRVNVFRALLESIIAALSVTVPPIKCIPDDAENPSDILTAKSGDKITELVYKHNDAPLLWVHGLFIYCTEGLIAAYNYAKEDYKYGSYETPKYEEGEITEQTQICSVCQQQIAEQPSDEFQPTDEDVEYHAAIAQGMKFCARCQLMVFPEEATTTRSVTRLVGTTKNPKSRQCIEVYGNLNVKLPNYARKIDEAPYLRYAYEVHYTEAIKEFPQLVDKETGEIRCTPGGMTGNDIYERWARLAPEYGGAFPENVVSIRKYWLRPSTIYVENDLEKRKALLERFPDGIKVSYVNDEYVESENESLNDHWTINRNPVSDYIHYDAHGTLITSIQEITDDLISLLLQTIEHGIPQTFADPTVLDFNLYKKTEVAPGSIFPIKAKAGKNLSESFYEVKTATLSQEVQPFVQKIQEYGQFVSGALPAIFGAMESKTAAQDSMSKAQALQRLQNIWKMLNFWWKDIFGKVIPQYIKNVKEDEKYATRDPQNKNNYINVVIRKAELEGKLGDIELEASDQLPMTWAQQKDIIMQLMQVQNPEVMAAITSPENAGFISQAIGLNNFFVPGEDERLKQLDEIALLLQSEPIPSLNNGFGENPDGEPSVPIEPLLDNHQIEGETCRKWLISPIGRQAKTDNPPGYMNVMLHYKAHMMTLQMLNVGQPPQGEQQQPQGAAPNPKPKKPSSQQAAKQDVSGDSNATSVH